MTSEANVSNKGLFDDIKNQTPNSEGFLSESEHEKIQMAQYVNSQQPRMPDTFFYGNMVAPSITTDDQDNTLIQKKAADELPATDTSADTSNLEKKNTLGIKYHDIQYEDGDLIPSIKPAFIKQYYIRFITNVCINLVRNPTVSSVRSAQTRRYYKEVIVPSINLKNDVSSDLDSKLALSVFSNVERHKNENEGRPVHWHYPEISSLTINDRTLEPITHHDVILPIYDDVFSNCTQQNIVNSLLSYYSSLYTKLPVTTNEYSDGVDMHHNPQHIKKLTSLQQSINFLKTTSWYLFAYELNSLFTNKRKKTLSYARGYLLALSKHYGADNIALDESVIKNLSKQVSALRYWVDGKDHSYLNLSGSQPYLSQRYAHHSISSHQLDYEVLLMLSKPIVKNEALNNLNYDIDNGTLYLAGMNEVMRFWTKKLSIMSEDGSTENENLRNSILKTATKKARTFYPPSALYLED